MPILHLTHFRTAFLSSARSMASHTDDAHDHESKSIFSRYFASLLTLSVFTPKPTSLDSLLVVVTQLSAKWTMAQNTLSRNDARRFESCEFIARYQCVVISCVTSSRRLFNFSPSQKRTPVEKFLIFFSNFILLSTNTVVASPVRLFCITSISISIFFFVRSLPVLVLVGPCDS